MLVFFQYFKYYLPRMEYSLKEYFDHRISVRNLLNVHFVQVSSFGFISMSTLFAMSIIPKYQPICNLYGKMLNIERLDLVSLSIFNVMGVIEAMSIFVINKTLLFKINIHKLIFNYTKFNDQRLFTFYRNYLNNYFKFIFFFAPVAYFSIIFCAIFVLFFIFYNYILLYFKNQISLHCWFMEYCMFIIFLRHSVYICGQLFYMMPLIMYFVELLKVRLLQFVKISNRKLLKRIDLISPRLFFGYFLSEYNCLFDETSKLNELTKYIFLFCEYASKMGIIFCAIFIAKQTQISFFGYLAVSLFLTLFFLTTFVYSRMAVFSYLADVFVHVINQWNARNQYEKPKLSLHKKDLRVVIKTNLFIQTASRNHFGFSCGNLFKITQFKYIELFLLNFSLILLFYKKIC